jgi:Lecithin:cholesterol acyltransferase
MGGVLARRYIIDNPQSHSVEKLITVGTPWLGAPKAINVLETGEFADGKLQQWLTNKLFKTLAEFFPGMHELLPSRWFFNINDTPTYSVDKIPYSYSEFVAQLNRRYNRSEPGSKGSSFHDKAGQDDWRNDQSGVKFFHLYGRQSRANTIGQVVAEVKPSCFLGSLRNCPTHLEFDVKMTRGDGTVPEISATRTGKGLNLNAPGATLLPFVSRDDDQVSHQGLTDNPDVQGAILSALRASTQSSSTAFAKLIELNETTEPAQSHYLKISGASVVQVTDAFGNSTYPLNDAPDDGLPLVTSSVLGEKAVIIVLPVEHTHTVLFRAESGPLTIEITTGTGDTISQAIRFRDLTLPAGVEVNMQVTPAGIGQLVYDRDGDGTFESSILPTVSVTGPAAQDTESPTVTISETLQQASTSVTITAVDSGSGVNSIFYSFDSANYQLYTGPLSVNPLQTQTIYAFADDNVANRSGLVTYKLSDPVSTMQLSQAGYSVGEAAGNIPVMVTNPSC